MRFTYTDGTIHSEPDMCCGKMNTAGYCPQCNPYRPEQKSPLEEKLKKLAKNAPSIGEIWKITKRLPSFSQLLKERNEKKKA